MPRIAVDPVTRIEGHLRIEAEVNGGKVTNAWSSATMFRGLEAVFQNRDPRELWYWAQRICGVCTTVHALASVRAVENALGIEVPDNANFVRNLIGASQNVQDHVIHFYHLHALDWVDVTSALQADPQKTATLAQSISDWPNNGASNFKAVQTRVKTLVDSGQLSLFTNGYWGHPAYKLPPEANLMAVSHYLDALEFQRNVIVIHALLGGKNPHPQSYLVGGMSTVMDPNQPDAVINLEVMTQLQSLVTLAQTFVTQVYIPDVIAIAGFYKDWFGLGEGVGNFMSFGDFPTGGTASINSPAQFVFPQGLIMNRDLTKVLPVDIKNIAEYVTHSWYKYSDAGANAAKAPQNGETIANFTGPNPPWTFLDTGQKYSWLKSPRYQNNVVEVGPLARVLVAYALGKQPFKQMVDGALAQLGAPPTALFSTLGRVAARAIESQVMAEQMQGWLNSLGNNLAHGNLEIFNGQKWDPGTWPATATGFGFHEAPRGSLGHWVQIENQKIKHYQVISPTTWNGGPRDAAGQPGPYEAALVNTPIANPDQPLEILRTVHSFDPCIACGVQVVSMDGKSQLEVRVR
jgi:Ni,Fe-hydrogenase I large subunit